MITARSGFDPVVLANGKVLVAGGNAPYPANQTASCELYDPVTGTWSATGSLLQPRDGYHATLLADGRVLVAGGFNDTAGLIPQSEVYDPNTGAWTNSGSLELPREGNVQVRLTDGRVLVVGGISRLGHGHRPPEVTASAEIYERAAGIWNRTGTLDVPRLDFTANVLKDGKVFAAGGWDTTFQYYSSIGGYNPATGTWRTLAHSLAGPRFGHTATMLADGSLIVAGGRSSAGGPLIPAAELFVRPK